VCPHFKRKIDRAINTKVDTDIVHISR